MTKKWFGLLRRHLSKNLKEMRDLTSVKRAREKVELEQRV
jgi:hypothetical protein